MSKGMNSKKQYLSQNCYSKYIYSKPHILLACFRFYINWILVSNISDIQCHGHVVQLCNVTMGTGDMYDVTNGKHKALCLVLTLVVFSPIFIIAQF